MSQDDGLILNFAPSEGSSAENYSSKIGTKTTGGRWKERRKLQLRLSGRARGKRRNDKSNGETNESVNSDPSSNTQGNRIISKPKSSNSIQEKPNFKRAKLNEKLGAEGGKNNSYVSSLFTSAPASDLLQNSGPESYDKTTQIPSNAPLLDSTSFSGLGINLKLSKHLTDALRYISPTSIQRCVIPNLIDGKRDLFVRAQTGSGKTLSFLLPIYHLLMTGNTPIRRDSGLFAIILAPTRELATQIYGVLETLSRICINVVPGIVIGGEKRKSEKARIRKGVNILVGTPGRLADHMENTKSFDASQVRWLILDEGDKLMDLGFEETIAKITQIIQELSKIEKTISTYPQLPEQRINVLCSATIQENVERLGNIVLNDPLLLDTSVNKNKLETSVNDNGKTKKGVSVSREATAPDQLVQRILVVPPKLRLVTLAALLKKISNDATSSSSSRTMVFFSCSDSVDFHFDIFTRDGKALKKEKNEETGKAEIQWVSKESVDLQQSINCATAPFISSSTAILRLHGSLPQQERVSTLQNFLNTKNFDLNHVVLFCTDVASRGLDLPDISQVIEFDPPFTIEDHLHRVGRSARAGKNGEAILFLLPGDEEKYLEDKVKLVHNNKNNIIVSDYNKVLEDGFARAEPNSKPDSSDAKHKVGKWDIHATTWHLDVERWILSDSKVHESAVKAFISHVRAYATHLASERKYFNVKELHLGHIAKSFGLRETPKNLGKSAGTKSKDGSKNAKQKLAKEDSKKKMLRIAKLAVRSTNNEFNY